MPYYATLEEDLARAKAILEKGKPSAWEQANFTPEVIEALRQASGGTIYGADVYAAYKLLESFVGELEHQKAEVTRAVLRYTVRGYTAGENADSKHWRERAEAAESRCEALEQENKQLRSAMRDAEQLYDEGEARCEALAAERDALAARCEEQAREHAAAYETYRASAEALQRQLRDARGLKPVVEPGADQADG